MGVIHVTSAEQFSQLKNSKSTFGSPAAVVVDFSAEVSFILYLWTFVCCLHCMLTGVGCCASCVLQWCGPCKMIAPVFEQLSNTYTSVKFCKIDVDELQVRIMVGACSVACMHQLRS